MSFVILAYSSRNQTARMYEVLRANGIPCRIVNTPREANLGCGISVRFEERDLAVVRSVAYQNQSSTFVGFFRVYPKGNGGYHCERI